MSMIVRQTLCLGRERLRCLEKLVSYDESGPQYDLFCTSVRDQAMICDIQLEHKVERELCVDEPRSGRFNKICKAAKPVAVDDPRKGVEKELWPCQTRLYRS